MTFDKVLPSLREGNKVSRLGWNRDMWLFVGDMMRPEVATSDRPLIYLHTARRDYVWTANSIDILADDWQVL